MKRVILAAHRIVAGATNKMRHRRRQFDHLFCLCDIIDPFGAINSALCTVEERFDQQRLSAIAAQTVDLPILKRKKAFVFQRLHRPRTRMEKFVPVASAVNVNVPAGAATAPKRQGETAWRWAKSSSVLAFYGSQRIHQNHSFR